MSAHCELIRRALRKPDCVARYDVRRYSCPRLARLVPDRLADVATNIPPWFCHGLGWRLATWHNDDALIRLETLLALAEQVSGWEREWRQNWAEEKLADYERFFHLLWMLQCTQFFTQEAELRFLSAKTQAPDLGIVLPGGVEVYIECYVYSKWWFVEVFLNDLLKHFGDDLSLERTYNIARPGFRSDADRVAFLDHMVQPVADAGTLRDARRKAKERWPVELQTERGWRLFVGGSNMERYEPQPNAHGDPMTSLSVYLQEIVNAKENQNDLANRRPNLVMANSLGTDFQLTFGRPERVSNAGIDFKNLDGLVAARCGLNSSIRESPWFFLAPSDGHPLREMFERIPPLP